MIPSIGGTKANPVLLTVFISQAFSIKTRTSKELIKQLMKYTQLSSNNEAESILPSTFTRSQNLRESKQMRQGTGKEVRRGRK